MPVQEPVIHTQHLRFPPNKGVHNNKPLLMYGGWTKSTQTTQHNTTAQWERSSNSPSPALVVAELRWYEKKKKKTIQDQWRRRRELRGERKKSHGIKQSVPRARQRSDCVAEWVILLHLLPQQGGCVPVCVCVDSRDVLETERERASKRKRCSRESEVR